MKSPYPSRDEVLETNGALDAVRAYLGGGTDFQAIQEYLHLPPPTDLARIAAQLGSRDTSEFSRQDLVALADDLYQDAVTHTEQQRQKIVSGMNRATLIELANRLEITGKDDDSVTAVIDDWRHMSVQAHILSRYDPVQCPVIARLGDMDAKADSVADGFLTVGRPAAILEHADSCTTLPRPGPDSELADALRWAVSEPRTSKQILLTVFDDCVRYSLAQIWVKDPNLEAEVGKDEASQIFSYLENYKPTIPVPDYIEWLALSEVSYNWKPFFVTPGKLAWLAHVFKDFWKSHADGYSKKRMPDEAKLLRDKRKQAGQKGVKNRENKAYMNHSRAFVSFLRGKQVPQDEDSRQELFNDFARNYIGRRTRSARTNIVDFLEILYAHRDEEPKSVLARLCQLRLLKFEERPDEERNLIVSKMENHEKSLLQRGLVPKRLLLGWGFDEAGVRSCLEILSPAFSRKPGQGGCS